MRRPKYNMRKNKFLKPDGKISIVPSVLSADFFCLRKDISKIEKHSDWIQVDVMDGHFVPNLSFGPCVVQSLKKVTNLPIDVHLMVQHPEKFIEPFYNAGANLMTIHLESECNIKRCLAKIKNYGLRTGIAVKPETDIKKITEFLNIIDLVLIMTVDPGFGGQKFMRNMLAKISQARKIINDARLNIWLQVDGGINQNTGVLTIESGADCLVIGSALFSSQNPVKLIKCLKNCKNI
jgi:ribulose-phosphate 3-epimerase